MASIDENGSVTPADASEEAVPAPGAADPAQDAITGEAPSADEAAEVVPPDVESAQPEVEEAPAVEAEVPAAEEAPAVEAEAPAAEDAPAVEAEAPAAEDAPAVEAEAPAAEEAPAVEAEAPAAEDAPAVEAEAPAAEEAPAVEAEAPAAEEAPAVEGDAPAAEGEPAADAGPKVIDGNDPVEVAFALRQVIVEEAERLRTSTAWSKASQTYRELLDRWRQAGSAGKERDAELWTRFEAARDGFYQARNHHHAERARIATAASETKKRLVEETEKLLDTADPRQIGEGLDRLMAEWKTAGHAGSEEGQLWQAFRAARDRAFTARRELAAARDRARHEVRAAKQALIEQAEKLGELRDIGELEAALEQQMEDWKKAGTAGRKVDDELWERFRQARGAAFGRLRGLRSRAERGSDSGRRAPSDPIGDAMRLAYTDAPVREQDLQRFERAWEKASESASDEQKAQWEDVIARLRERASKPQPTGQSSAGSLMLAKQEEIVRRLEERIETLRDDEFRERELRKAEKELAEERQKLERMSALLGAAS